MMGSNLWNAEFSPLGPVCASPWAKVPMVDPFGVVTSGFLVKNRTGFCYRGIFIMD